MDEHRQHQRTAVDLNVEFVRRDPGAPSDARVKGRARDISLGGMFVHTSEPPTFGSEIVVHVTLTPRKGPFALPAVVRWTRRDGMGIQFRPLGARETHAIMELTKAPGA